MEIKFIEHKTAGYASRTRENVKLSDLTIAFGVDLYTPGEKLTRNTAGQKYCSVQLIEKPNEPNEPLIKSIRWRATVVSALKSYRPAVINIAGNGIYNFTRFQEDIDEEICEFLNVCFHISEHTPDVIRSGGQTGIDEAGLNAAVILDIQPICLAPKGWVFRDAKGKDISDETQFKARFLTK